MITMQISKKVRKTNSLLIIDGNNLAHRCKHTFSLSNHGVDVSITYGFLRVLGSMLEKYKPSSVIVCWDGGVPEFRKKSVPEYKSNRHTDDDPFEYDNFLRQVEELHGYILPIMGVISSRKIGAEADDLIYHASRMYVGNSVIVTSDKDLLQAVCHDVMVYNPARDTLYTPDTLEIETGVPVSQYIDWRAIQGDSSDNIPGVRGIGEKTATKLFKEYGSLTNIVNAALGFSPKHSVMNDKIRSGILAFGMDKIVNNILITALYADRVGARAELLAAVEEFIYPDTFRVKKYFMANGFVSLIDGVLLSNVKSLTKPELSVKDMRVPMIFQKQRIAFIDTTIQGA